MKLLALLIFLTCLASCADEKQGRIMELQRENARLEQELSQLLGRFDDCQIKTNYWTNAYLVLLSAIEEAQ